MNDHRTTCDPERIELFLQQKLSDEEQSAFESHLDDCRDCRRRLETAAAGDEVWSDVRESLKDRQFSSDMGQSGESTVDRAKDDDAPTGHETVLGMLSPTDDDRMLGRLGPYEIVGVVGSGGMGVVLKAFDAPLNRYVAIKVLAPHLGNSGAARKRFMREAQAAAAVVHENVMEIYGVADTKGLSYLVMPYVRGPSLQRRLDDNGPLALAEILRIGMQAASGLAAAHAQGLVHRDVKPANILLADGVERVKLTDFGLARAVDDASLTKTGFIAGTPQYMSPEQARGEPLDHRSDLFSLGSVLYAMCTGRAPFRAETSYGVLRRITDEEPRSIREINGEIPDWLCWIVGKLMSKKPDERFGSAEEVAKLLEECLSHVQQPTGVPLPSAIPRPATRTGSKRRNIFRKGVIIMFATFGVALLGMMLAQITDPPDIAGTWSSEETGQLLLDRTSPGEYSGSYQSAVGKTPGNIELSWSRLQRRFNGTWREGDDCFGELSVRLVDGELRGARTTDPKSKVDPTTPRLTDLVWKRNEKMKIGNEKTVVNAEKNSDSLQGQWKLVKEKIDKNSHWFNNDKVLSPPEFMTFFVFEEGNPDKNIPNTFTYDGFGRSPNPHRKEICTYRIDPTATPKRIEMFDPRDSGKPDGDKPVAVGIYEIQDDSMKLCWRMCEPGEKNPQYPQSFIATPTSLVVYLERYSPTADEKALQGDWIIVSTLGKNTLLRGELQGKVCSFHSPAIEFSNNHSSSMFDGQFELIEATEPKEIRVTSFWQESVQREIEKLKLNGIYKLDGNRLTIAYRRDAPTPAKFESDADSDITLLELQRLESKSSMNVCTIESNSIATSDLAVPEGRWNVVQLEKGKESDPFWKAIMNGNPFQDFHRLNFNRGYLYFSDFKKETCCGIFYTIDPVKRTIDLAHESSSAKERKVLAMGTYSFEGNRLRIHFARRRDWVTNDQRPTGFSLDPNSEDVCFLLERPSADEERMKGYWTLVDRLEDGNRPETPLVYHYNEGITHFDDIAILKTNAEDRNSFLLQGRIMLDAGKEPKTIAIHTREGDEKTKTVELHGIYRFDGDLLTIAYRKNGPTPDKFESTPGSGTTLLELQRGNPKPSVDVRPSESNPSAVDPPKEKLAAPPVAEESTTMRDRHFVKLVVGKNKMTFEGLETDAASLAGLLEKVPDRAQTVLELGWAPEDVNDNQREGIVALAMYYGKALGFEYLSDVGTHPLGSKGDPTQKIPISERPNGVVSGGLSHRVPFELGATNLRGGDQISIEEINGTADEIKPGNMYEVKGTYRLASRDSAVLAAYVTVETRDWKANHVPELKTQTTTVKRGEEKFTLLFYMWGEGKPHLSFYPENGGEGLGGIYFGTGDSVLKKGWWEDRPKDKGNSP